MKNSKRRKVLWAVDNYRNKKNWGFENFIWLENDYRNVAGIFWLGFDSFFFVEIFSVMLSTKMATAPSHRY